MFKEVYVMLKFNTNFSVYVLNVKKASFITNCFKPHSKYRYDIALVLYISIDWFLICIKIIFLHST